MPTDDETKYVWVLVQKISFKLFDNSFYFFVHSAIEIRRKQCND